MPDDDDDDLPDSNSATFGKADVEARVHDWLTRLNGFFRENSQWAQSQGWTIDLSGRVPMHEHLMQKFRVSAAQQPVLRIDSPQGGYALFKPKGLWVIGANGRIDLYTGKGAFVIIDQAEKFEPPKWRLFRSENKREGVAYDPALLSGLM